jgi:hypothetical protein
MNKQRTEMEKVTHGFLNVKCIAISVLKLKIVYMYEPAFSTLPEDKEWVNLVVVADIENEYFIRLGVGQVSKAAWDDWANAESRGITLV